MSTLRWTITRRGPEDSLLSSLWVSTFILTEKPYASISLDLRTPDQRDADDAKAELDGTTLDGRCVD